MLTEQQISDNKNEFMQAVASINIEGADLAGLMNWLNNSDFFTAPASTQYHGAFKGGLCWHTLNVYHNILKLHEIYKDILPAIDPQSLIIVSLFHDVSKIDYYEPYIMNKKVYNPNGSKHDNMGNFDWVAQEAYKVKDAKDRFLAVNHGINSALLIGRFIPLSLDENVAIMNHMLNTDDKANNYDQSAILNKYPLLALLHMADFASTFINEAERE